ncbi:hypothetical protein DRO66_06570 [Candidatus Bathyarchaeota archaeon]|nr:MAG: hypothetical protein DRO66_06570 [Candidatus Bathyarchaeota archaeon]
MPTALTVIPTTTCPEELGQIQRFIFVRRGGVRWDTADPTATGKSTPASIQPNLPTVSAGWTTLKALSDDDKVIFTPLLGGDPTITPGDQITFGGGDNSTLNGETYHVAFNPADGSFRFDSLTAEQTAAMKELVCESLEVYMINSDGDIIGERDTIDADLWHGFKVFNPALGGRNLAGFGTRDSNVLTLQLNDDWDTKFEKQTPTDFNALTF